jgi:molybdopterin molybdotransferase
MLNAQAALDIVLSSVKLQGTLTVALERAHGLVQAEDILASENVPPFDNAGMDGYAVRAEDVQVVPAVLRVVGEIAAGSAAEMKLSKGEAIAVMTGAKIPSGCDAVVQIERTESCNDGQIKVLQPVTICQNIRRAGDDIEKNKTVLTKGDHLKPQHIGVLASIGKRFVQVYRPPTVAILATGNELVTLDVPLADGKIRNSNAYSLAALVQEIGGLPDNLGIAKDDREDLTNKIHAGLDDDMLIISGGVSVGKYDLVIENLKSIGVEVKFWKVNIKPGMPLVFGIYRGKPVFGLPGNPVSTVITFLQFVKPALMKMMGYRKTDSSFKIRAKLAHDIVKTDGKKHFIRAILENSDGSMTVRSIGSQASNALLSLAKANCLIVLSEETEIVHAGEEVEVELL